VTSPAPRHQPTVTELRREQRDEAKGVTYGQTRAQVHGALLGGLVFGAIGLVIGVLIGLVAFDAGSPARFVVPAVITAFAAWAGIVYWGGRAPEVEDETTTIYGDPEDGTSPRPTERPR
jgi:hypothetical protein